MNKEQLKAIVNDPKHISGIYNYCDRWCERCTFTSRCSNYALSEEQFPDTQDRDIRNRQFWDRLSEILKLSFEMIQDHARENGIDLENLEDAEEAKRAGAPGNDLADKCVKAAEEYGLAVDKWFEANEKGFAEIGKELALKEELRLSGANPLAEFAELKDIVQVIRWYQHQIHVKLSRAYDGIREDTTEADGGDSAGSAKVALTGIDRSISAWHGLFRYLPDSTDSILDIAAALSRLRRDVETAYPLARAFIRPGFDTI